MAVVTSGTELDPDGYTIEVVNDPDEMMSYWAQDTVGTNGTTALHLPAGAFYIFLAGIAPNCTAVPPRWTTIYTPNSFEQLVTLKVECLRIPATQGVRVTTVTTGTNVDTRIFGLTIQSDVLSNGQEFEQTRQIGANESITMLSPVGWFYVMLDVGAIWRSCTITPSAVQKVLVEQDQMKPLTFNVACVP